MGIPEWYSDGTGAQVCWFPRKALPAGSWGMSGSSCGWGRQMEGSIAWLKEGTCVGAWQVGKGLHFVGIGPTRSRALGR